METAFCKKIIFCLLSVAGCLLLVGIANAQTDADRVTELRRQIEELEKQAAEYRGRITQEHTEQQTLNREIAALDGQIKNLQLQISLTGKKIDKTKIEIDDVGGQIFDTQERISARQAAIGQLLMSISKMDNDNLLAVLIKNKNISDFFNQSQYADSISRKLLALIGEMKSDKRRMEEQKGDLEQKKSDLEKFNRDQASKRVSLSGTKVDKKTLLARTKGEEAQYQKLLNDVEKRKAEFFNELRKLESDTIAGGLYIVHVTADRVPPRGTKLFQWPEDDFWITQGYGMTRYARRGAYGGAPHNGIDLTSGFGSPIKAIGDGEIVANGYNNGWGNWAAVKHLNNMVSIYGHMSSLSSLKVGAAVKTGDAIGYEGATGNATGSHLHLSLYKDFFTYLKNDQLYFNYFEGSLNPDDYI